MINKKNNHYKLALEALRLKDETRPLEKLELEVENHDDLFKVIDVVKAKNFLIMMTMLSSWPSA